MTPVAVGMSVATVERWTRQGDVRFVKTAAATWDRGLDAEAARLRWLATTPLADRVAAVVSFEDGEVQRLETTAVAGVDVAALAVRAGVSTWKERHPPGDPAVGTRLADAFGRALRQLHDGLDPSACPFDMLLDVRLDAAARRVAEGGVDADDFEPEHADRTPAQLLDRLQRTRPADEDLVVTHGDWCFPNVLFDDERPGWWGMVDLGGLGVACRWNDLGIGSRTTMHNVGAEAVPAFFEGYGVEPDQERVDYYVLLDELQ